MMKEMYKRFVEKVADGRNKSPDEIEKIAQGRVWSGSDAKNLGLVDVIGGLTEAIEIARVKANLKKDEYEIVEFPEPEVFNLSLLISSPINTSLDKNPLFQMLSLQLKNNGKPLMLMPVEFIPDENLMYDFNK
jgi:protease-4